MVANATPSLACQEPGGAAPPPAPQLLAVLRRITGDFLPGACHSCRLGDRTVPDRHQRQRRRPASQPVFRRRPARPVLAAGSDVQSSTSLLCRAPRRAAPGRPRANPVPGAVRKRLPFIQRFDLAECNAVRVREADRISVGAAERLPHPHSRTNADAHPGTYPDAYPHTNAHAKANTHANAHANANTHANAHANTHPHAHTHADANTDAHTDPNPNANTDAHAHADSDPDANTDARAAGDHVRR